MLHRNWSAYSIIATSLDTVTTHQSRFKVSHSGSVVMVISAGSTSSSASITYVSAYATVPNIALGTNILQTISTSFATIVLDLQVNGSVATAGFNIACTLDTSTNISSISISYVSIDSTYTIISSRFNANYQTYFSRNTCYNSVAPVKSGSGYRSASNKFNYVGTPVDLSHVNKMILFIQGVTMARNNGPYLNITTTYSFSSSTQYILAVSTSHNCSITRFIFSRIIIDKTAVESTLTTFMDCDKISATATTWSSLNLALVWMTPLNIIVGMSGFTIGATGMLNYNYSLTGLTCTGSSSFTYLEFSYFNYRFRTCPSGFPYYLLADAQCYDTCPAGYVPNTTINSCTACSYQCLTCSLSNSLTCLTCDATSFRVLSGTTCICMTGYYDVGVILCATCSYTCLSCNSALTCTSCSAMNFRTLTSGQCPCISGYVNTGAALCSSCSNLMAGCTACTSSSVCTSCGGGYLLSGGVCVCSVGTYASGSTCTLCSATMVGCTACTSASVCTACNTTSFFQLSGSNCSCLFGYYNSSSSCLSCSTVMAGCVSCTNSTNCIACDVNLHYMVDPTLLNCTCTVGYYLGGTACIACSSAIQQCSQCTSSTVCTGCVLPSVLTGATCGCGPGTYDDGLGNCIGCSTTLLGCTLCTSATICTACDATAHYVLSAGTCQCSSGFVLNGGSCVVGCPATNQFFNGTLCLSCHVTCATCLDQTLNNCTSCLSPTTLQGSQCLCPVGQYIDATFTCQYCDPLCQTCVNSATNCTGCNVPLVIDGSTCICQSGLYMAAGSTFCLPCDPSCVNCSGSGNNQCSACAPTFVLTGTTCSCATLQYIDPVTGNCTPCHFSCLTCNGTTSSNCITCDPANSRSISGTSCPCNTGKFDIGRPACYSSNCQVGYGPDSNGLCQEICGDGALYVLPCDDGNTVSGDGCSSTCDVEANYTCQGGNSTSPSVCSYNQPITLTLISTTKNLTENIVYFDIQISPALPSLNGLNFSSVLTSNLTGANLSFSYNSSTGRLRVDAQYASSIQSQNVSLLFTPSSSSSSPFFFATPPTNFSFVINPDNNLAAESLDSDTYTKVRSFEILWQVLLYLSLAGMMLSMFTARFIGVEMIGVIQIAFLGLMMIDHLQPLIAPMAKIFPINGLNIAFSSSTLNKNVPNRAAGLQYGASMAYNFNYSLILLLLSPLISLAVYISSKIRRDIEDKLKKISMNILCDFGMTAICFLIYHITASLGLFIVFDSPQTVLYGGSVAEAIVVVLIVATILVLFRYFPANFGDYRRAFQQDLISQYHYYLIVVCRVMLATIITIANDSARVGYVCLIPSVFALAYLSVKRPYLKLYNNIRAICNEVVVFITLLIYAYYRSGVVYQSHMTTTNTALPYILALLLYGCVVGNIVFMIKFRCDRIREKKTEEMLNSITKIQNEENFMFLEQSRRKLSVLALTGVTDRQQTMNPLQIENSSSRRQIAGQQLQPDNPNKPASSIAEPPFESNAKEIFTNSRKRPELKDKLLRSKVVRSPKIYEMERQDELKVAAAFEAI